MMKFSVVFMILLHVCLSFNLSVNLNMELINGLKELNKSYSALPAEMRVPNRTMQNKAKHCLGVFIKELRKIVNDVTVPEEHMNIVRGIQANLDHMGKHKENDQDCKMVLLPPGRQPFLQFIYFIKRLISQQ